MRIALVDAFPNLTHTAEKEFVSRFAEAATRLGHETAHLVTSDEIIAWAPDFVIATHEFTPKLTPHLTFGCMWSPPSFYQNDRVRLQAIASYDGHLIGSPAIRKFIEDLEFASEVSKPKTPFLFLPVAQSRAFAETTERAWQPAYVGVHWDGDRHGALLKRLDGLGLLDVYGPANSWRDYAKSYKGDLPFDGTTLLHTLEQHGIALCLHKAEHKRFDVPSMRLFEAAAAGCLIVADELPFARALLGDSAFYIDASKSADAAAGAIAEHVAWARARPDEALAMARESHRRVQAAFSIESLIEKTCAFAAEVVAQSKRRKSEAVASFATAAAGAADGRARMPLVDVIVRSGSRSADFAARAIESIAAQECGPIRVLLVDYKGRDDLAALAHGASSEATPVTYLVSEDTGLRSTATWTGLQQVQAPFFAVLDDDDTVMPDHFAELLAAAQVHPDAGLIYSGAVRLEEDGVFIEQPHHKGPLERPIEERRELKFIDAYDFNRLFAGDNYIHSGAWIARSHLLDARILADPGMLVAEDMYLYFLLAARTRFFCNQRATAYWHWRSNAGDNSMVAVDQRRWDIAVGTMKRRLANLQFPIYRCFDPVADAASPTSPLPDTLHQPGDDLPFLRIGVAEPVGPALLRRAKPQGFYRYEPFGLWMSAKTAALTVQLAEGVVRGVLRLNIVASGAKTGERQVVTIGVNDLPHLRVEAGSWQETQVACPLTFAEATADLRIELTCEKLVRPSDAGMGNDDRLLGACITSVLVTRRRASILRRFAALLPSTSMDRAR